MRYGFTAVKTTRMDIVAYATMMSFAKALKKNDEYSVILQYRQRVRSIHFRNCNSRLCKMSTAETRVACLLCRATGISNRRLFRVCCQQEQGDSK